jgi:hypothetical protein
MARAPVHPPGGGPHSVSADAISHGRISYAPQLKAIRGSGVVSHARIAAAPTVRPRVSGGQAVAGGPVRSAPPRDKPKTE